MNLYHVEKWNMATFDKVADLGELTEEEVKEITAGFEKANAPALVNADAYFCEDKNVLFVRRK